MYFGFEPVDLLVLTGLIGIVFVAMFAFGWSVNMRRAYRLLVATGLSALLLSMMVGVNLRVLYDHPDYSIWPVVTTCEICKERVFAWEGYERREVDIRTFDTDGNEVHVTNPTMSMTMLVHEDCEGTVESRVEMVPFDDEPCDVRDNDCGDIPITYEGNDVIIHEKGGDIRIPNWSGSNFPVTDEPPQTYSLPLP